MDAILDTSVLIAESEAGLKLPGVYGISVMSLAELHRGAVTASSAAIRARRVARLALVEELYATLPVDRQVAVKYGEIAATAIVLGLPLLTRDHDFDRIPELEVVIV